MQLAQLRAAQHKSSIDGATLYPSPLRLKVVLIFELLNHPLKIIVIFGK